MIRLGIDAGGTFTDAVLWNDESGILGTSKVPSDNLNPANAVYLAAKTVCEKCEVDIHEVHDLVHGTTVATNLSLESNGPRIALLTTKGFRDVLEIGRLTRPSSALYDLLDPGRKAIIDRRDRFEIEERIDKSGAEIRALDSDEVVRAVKRIQNRGIRSVAVCYLFSFANDLHERETERIIHTVAPTMHVSLSSEILPQVREYERTAATAINAYLQPKCGPYLDSLSKKFNEHGIDVNIWVMQSNGGVTTPQYAAKYPINLLMSGPSGGVVAVEDVARQMRLNDAISIDMGGTSFDVSCIVDRTVPLSQSGEAMGMPLRIPSVDISTIGTGGGSIAFADIADQLHVGPQSAGAVPGPACYGKGGALPTVTDANAVLGYLADGTHLGGGITISREAAIKACTPLSKHFGISEVELAQGIRRISTESMAGAVRAITIGKGKDPRDFTLVAFGGAGPLHAVDIARAMGISRVVIPRAAGVLSAVGLVRSDVVHTFTSSVMGQSIDKTFIQDTVHLLISQAKKLDTEIPGGNASYKYIFDMRYAGQNSTIQVSVVDPFDEQAMELAEEEFNVQHQRLNGYSNAKMDTCIDAINLVYTKRMVEKPQSYERSAISFETTNVGAKAHKHQTIWNSEEGRTELPVFDLDTVNERIFFPSPCILTSSDTTIVIPECVDAMVDEDGNIIINITEEAHE
ncbi:hydantoinase/oxoprolinase family protein [Bifidobacterium aquikefiri]